MLYELKKGTGVKWHQYGDQGYSITQSGRVLGMR